MHQTSAGELPHDATDYFRIGPDAFGDTTAARTPCRGRCKQHEDMDSDCKAGGDHAKLNAQASIEGPSRLNATTSPSAGRQKRNR